MELDRYYCCMFKKGIARAAAFELSPGRNKRDGSPDFCPHPLPHMDDFNLHLFTFPFLCKMIKQKQFLYKIFISFPFPSHLLLAYVILPYFYIFSHHPFLHNYYM